jgi:2-iminobutanoate/2-iminopropanoate deaminase
LVDAPKSSKVNPKGGGMARQAVSTPAAPSDESFSQAVVAGNLVFVAGTTGLDTTTGTYPAGIAAQAEQALKNIAAVLAEAGCSLDDVVKTTSFVTPGHPREEYRGVVDAFMRACSDPPPARSAPRIAGFGPEGVLISIEAIAVKPS